MTIIRALRSNLKKNIETHLMLFLRIFRGMTEYDKEFGERAHRNGIKHDRCTVNLKSFKRKAELFELHNWTMKNPEVIKEAKGYEEV